MALGEHQRCPHCHAIADVERSAEARFVCSICGGVRIPIDDPKVTRSSEQLELLRRATAARSSRTVWLLIALVVAAFGVFSALVLWLAVTFAHPPEVATAAAIAAVLVPFGFALFSFRRSRASAAALHPALDKAWEAAALDLARSRGELDAGELAKRMRISETEAERLLARLAAESLLSISAATDGTLKYALVEARAAEADKSLPAAR
jgi:hypothetical protein